MVVHKMGYLGGKVNIKTASFINHFRVELNFFWKPRILNSIPVVKSSQVAFSKNKWQSHEFYKHVNNQIIKKINIQ